MTDTQSLHLQVTHSKNYHYHTKNCEHHKQKRFLVTLLSSSNYFISKCLVVIPSVRLDNSLCGSAAYLYAQNSMHKAPTLSILSGFHAFLIQQYKYRLVVGGTSFFFFFFLSGEEEGGVSMNTLTCFTVEFTGIIFFF